MKLFLVTFLASWLALLFATLETSTDAYEQSALAGLWPLYIASVALFCIFFVSWKGNLFSLALLSACFTSSVAGLPYLKYPLLYGSVFDTMFHFSLAQTILNTGHVPLNNAYFGFTTFHSLTAIVSLFSGLPLTVAFKLELILLPALVQLAGYWIAVEVLRKRSTIKLAILGAIIAFTFNFTSGPQVMAAYLVILSLSMVLPFARTYVALPKDSLMASLLILVFGIVITHHQTAFFAIFAFIGIGLLIPLVKGILKTNALVVQRIELVGLLSLGFAYIWWTYYAGFTDLVRNVFSIITGEPIGFQTTAGRGISFYGPVTWALRTAINYAQRGQLLLWTAFGVLASLFALILRRESNSVDPDTHAIVFSAVILYLGVYVFFLFVPFFVIGSDRFFRFISFVSPPFIAMGIETVYSLIVKGLSRVSRKLLIVPKSLPLRSAVAFLLVVLLFVEMSSPLLLGGVYAASSEYQVTQIAFLNQHSDQKVPVISHVVITSQLQVYAPTFISTGLIQKADAVSVLYDLYSTNIFPTYALQSLILTQKVGPAGAYFEAYSGYSNATWVPSASAQILVQTHTLLLYNSGEAFITYQP